MSQAKLIELRRDTNAAIEALKKIRRRKSWAVNWADLRCIQAQFWEDDEGDKGYMVYVREASPNAGEFANEIVKALRSKWGPVFVETEW